MGPYKGYFRPSWAILSLGFSYGPLVGAPWILVGLFYGPLFYAWYVVGMYWGPDYGPILGAHRKTLGHKGSFLGVPTKLLSSLYWVLQGDLWGSHNGPLRRI